MVQLIKVGEETSQLGRFFERIANQYIDDVEHGAARLSTVLEPIIIIFLGIIVGVILVSIYLLLIQMSNSFQ
ncbi:hypothetical protein BC343_11795 [Mucilaginibacter pedocola]|uniref:Type II secretion system protein GspF domain-containing protein n=2 Tax=Mucilaginibacter pedocola TaxID=1792845 RepID=A0A1S9PBH5_9SPHI|nr:hypothetical protein BC343_11795 [Mucilaginibacter pedocola]